METLLQQYPKLTILNSLDFSKMPAEQQKAYIAGLESEYARTPEVIAFLKERDQGDKTLKKMKGELL